MFLLPLLLAVAQHPDRSTDRLPPANPLSPGEDAPAAVLAPLKSLLATDDPARVASLTLADGSVTAVTEDGPGTSSGPLTTRMPWAVFRVGKEVTVRLTDPAVDVDGNVATVWSPYVETEGQRTARCGVVQATLIHQSAGWRVLTMVHSIRHTGCDQLTAGAVRP